MVEGLDTRLAASRPVVAVRSPELTNALEELVLDRRPRRLWRQRPVVTAGVLTFALVGGGVSIAAAAPMLLGWFGLADNALSYTKDDESCKDGFRIIDTVNRNSETASLVAAREYLMGLDVESIDASSYLEITRGAHNPESAARGLAIEEDIIQHVEQLGLPTDGLQLESGGECGGENQ